MILQLHLLLSLLMSQTFVTRIWGCTEHMWRKCGILEKMRTILRKMYILYLAFQVTAGRQHLIILNFMRPIALTPSLAKTIPRGILKEKCLLVVKTINILRDLAQQQELLCSFCLNYLVKRLFPGKWAEAELSASNASHGSLREPCESSLPQFTLASPQSNVFTG